ncbi:hypothetical protein HMPREF0653_02529, partial [Prevotella disiens JCM 6334 = ATCC 29426]
ITPLQGNKLALRSLAISLRKILVGAEFIPFHTQQTLVGAKFIPFRTQQTHIGADVFVRSVQA